MVEAGGRWWRLVEGGGGWWKVVEGGTVDLCELPSSSLERPLLAPWCLPYLCALRRVGPFQGVPCFYYEEQDERRRDRSGGERKKGRGGLIGSGRSRGSRALGRELRFRGYRDPEQQRFGEREEGRRWEEALSGVCYDLEPLRGL